MPAEHLIRLYYDRWGIETAYCELNQRGRGLRIRFPAEVEHEVWALLTVYQMLRTAMADTILGQPDFGPDCSRLDSRKGLQIPAGAHCDESRRSE